MNPNEALICVKASEAIYGTQQEAGQAMQALGFDNLVWIDLESIFKDVCAFVASSQDYNIVVFRGTKTPRNFMTDFACTPVRFDWVFTAAPAIGEIHSGFGHSVADGLKEIVAALATRDQSKRLLLTGHSLGGALAALIAACFTVMGTAIRPISAIYTFGQPRIGLHDFCNTYGRILAGKLVRFVNQKDLVPRVPFRGFDYSDEGTMIHFDSTGKPVIESAEWQSFMARAVQSFEELMQMVTNFGVDVGDHAIAGYRKLVESNQAALGTLLK